MRLLGGDGNQFDKGIVIHEGGYNWPLSEWRQHYTRNVLAGGFTHESFCREYPKVSAALAESDQNYANWERVLKDPTAAAALNNIIRHLAEGGELAIGEAFPGAGQPAMAPPMAPQPQAPMQPPNATGDAHVHQIQSDAQGNGQTDAGLDGHTHPVRAGQIMAVNGHTHDANTMQAPQQQAQQPMQAQPANANPFAKGG